MLKRCPTEVNKFFGIGSIVLFTGMMAGISGGYFINSVFQNFNISVAFGIFWGALIFFLDRYIVSSLKKEYVDTPDVINSKEQVQIIKKKKLRSHINNFYAILPRVILATLLAFIISKPLELKMFENELKAEIEKEIANTSEEYRNKLLSSYDEQINVLSKEVDRLNNEIKDKEIYRNKLQVEWDNERFGIKTSSTSGIVGVGTHTKKKEEQLITAQNELNKTVDRNQKLIDFNLKKIDELNIEKSEKVKTIIIAEHAGMGPMKQINALAKLTKNEPAIWWVNFFIIMLFICVETSPIVVRLLTKRGPYDEIIERIEYQITAREKKIIAVTDKMMKNYLEDSGITNDNYNNSDKAI